MPHRHPGPQGASRNARNAISWLYRLSVLLFCFHSCGCATLTKPVADGLPVRNVPPEFLGESHEGEQTIPLDLLRQCPPDTYRLAPGDVLGIWIEGILGAQGQLPPDCFCGGADAAMLKEHLAHLRPGASLQEAGGLPAPPCAFRCACIQETRPV
jgi:hypothetical protein